MSGKKAVPLQIGRYWCSNCTGENGAVGKLMLLLFLGRWHLEYGISHRLLGEDGILRNENGSRINGPVESTMAKQAQNDSIHDGLSKSEPAK